MKKNSILLVDDSTQNCISLTHILDKDYNVYVSKDGHDAIETAKICSPDVILLDIIMPGMDGYEVLSVLNNHEKLKQIPVIFLTGLDDAGDEEKGLSMGAADYITRPYNDEVVKMRVKNQLRVRERIQSVERLMMIDKLTELPNRRSFDDRIDSEWGRSIRDKTPISILAIDIDNFKMYNDTFGHPQGDVALQSVAGVLSRQIKRSGDFAARWGGEEFFVILPNTDSKGAMRIADQIRIATEELIILKKNGVPTKITVSIGANTLLPSTSVSLNDFIAYADNALYAAKNSGKNKVCHASEVTKNIL